MSIDHYPRKSPFEISELAEFDKNIEFDSEDDKRRKRLAYLSQGMSQVGYGKSMMNQMNKSMGCMMLPFYIIPIFWPMLYFMRSTQKRAFTMLDEQIADALRYWSIDRSELDRYRS